MRGFLFGLSFFFGILAFKRVIVLLEPLIEELLIGRKIKQLQQVNMTLRKIQDALETGRVPEDHHWAAVRALATPWGPTLSTTLDRLRDQGAPILTTLRRFQNEAHYHLQFLVKSKAMSGQAWAQAILILGMVPILGLVLYSVLEGPQSEPLFYGVGVGVAWAFTWGASAWILKLSEQARWGQLLPEKRLWLFWFSCGVEQLMAWMRTGAPPDMAWIEVHTYFAKQVPGLAEIWGASIWGASGQGSSGPAAQNARGIEKKLIATLGSMRASIQVSLLEGSPATERIESAMQAFRVEVQGEIEKSLQELPTQVLKPLFGLGMPSVLLVLAVGLYLEWSANDFGFF